MVFPLPYRLPFWLSPRIGAALCLHSGGGHSDNSTWTTALKAAANRCRRLKPTQAVSCASSPDSGEASAPPDPPEKRL
eukprot:631578-Alexandrium_andersonii.AAC.1